jgi:hypothetical protein
MRILTEEVRQFQTPVYSRVSRSPQTYNTVARRCRTQLELLKTEYHAVIPEQEFDAGQVRREIRNDMDVAMRRYHKYCIKERDGMKAHYHEIDADEDCDFEHLIPAKIIRDMYLFGEIDVDHVLNAPTVKLSRAKHIMLKDAGWDDDTPDIWLPFTRYTDIFDAKFQTFDGVPVDPVTWNLSKHFVYFGHLVI